MLHQAICLQFLLLSLIFSVLSVSSMNSIIYYDCPKTYFASMTPYESNLNSLFTSLVDSASLSNFNKFEISQSDTVYGLFQCQGDLSPSDCVDCVTNSITQLKTTCPMSISGAIQLEGCFVKYDNTSFFGMQNKIEVWKSCGTSIGDNSDVLNGIDDSLTNLTSGSEQHFRGGDFGSIQGVAQCVQDLCASDCQDCLSEASERLRTECATSISADMFLGKCYLRYAGKGKGKRTHKGSSSSSSSCNNCDGDITTGVMRWTAIIVGIFVGGGSVTIVLKFVFKFSITNCCNINVFNELQKKVKEVTQKVDKHDKRIDVIEECKTKPIKTKTPSPCTNPISPCYGVCTRYPSYPSYPSHPTCYYATESPNACALM